MGEYKGTKNGVSHGLTFESIECEESQVTIPEQ